ncbi:hypothetical protein BGZ47_000422 [Haplosporangium gracile]|nr:hypothetical protein BGZ47_000422 [Haplosporangium gracile]
MADVQPNDSEAAQHHDTLAATTTAATATPTATAIALTATATAPTPTPTASTTITATSAVVKRGRGRPRKSEAGTGALNTFCALDEITGHPGILLGRPGAATGISSTSPLSGPNLSQQRPVAHLDSTNSTNIQCESCMTYGARLYKFGKLRVCKECEDLMRTMTGSSRRQTVAPPALPPPSSSSSSVSTASTKQRHNVSIAPVQKPQVFPAVSSTTTKHGHVQFSTISHFASVPHSTFNPSITTISPSSLVLVPVSKSIPVILTKRGEIAKKRGRKPKPRDESAHPVPSVTQDTQRPQQLTTDPTPEQAASKKRSRNPMALYPYNILPVTDPASVVVFKSKSATYVETSVTATPTASFTLPSPTDPSGSSFSHEDSFNFQTTGAFLTRTASKLLGGQEVIGVDSNIHGYAHGRLVKVQNIDKTWHFGAMVGLDRGKIKVHFDGWGPEWDEWITSDSRRLKVLDADEITLRNSLLLPPTQLASQVPTAVASEDLRFQQLPMDDKPTLQSAPALHKVSRPPTVALTMKPPKVLKPISVKRKLAPSMDDVVAALMVVDPDLPRPYGKMFKKAKTSETLDLLGESLPMPMPLIAARPKKPKLDKVTSTITVTTESSASSTAIIPIATTTTGTAVTSIKPANTMFIDLMSSESSTNLAPNNHTPVLSFTNMKTTKPKAALTKDVSKPPKLIAIAPKGSITREPSSTTAETTTPVTDKPIKLSLADARILLLGIEVGTKVQAQDKHGQWRPSTIVQIKARRVLVKYDECPSLANEWFIVNSNRLILPDRPLMGPLHEDSQIRATPKAPPTIDLKRRDSAWSPPIDVEAHTPNSCPATTSRSMSSSSSLSTAQSSLLSSPNTLELFSTSSDDLSEPGSAVSLPGDLTDKEPAKDDEPPSPPVPRPPHTLGNPILLDLPPYEIVTYEFEDQEKELLRIIHQVLNTGLIKNTVVKYSPEEYIPAVRVVKKKKRVVEGAGGEGAVEGEEGGDEVDGDDEVEVEKKVSKRTNDKTRERFEALMEARLERRNHRPSIFSPRKTLSVIRKKDPDVLQRIRNEATRNMCNIPVLRYVRQVIYKESDRLEALNSSFERQKQKFARAMSNRASVSNRMKIKRTSGPLSRRIFGLSNPNLTGITFNEAGYIESTNIPKPVIAPSPEALKKLKKMQKKRERLMKKKAMENPNQDLVQDDTVDDTFQNLRSLTRDNKNRKRPLKEDHITFLRRTMVAGTRIRSRDRQMEWLTAVIRDVKNSRVLVHYEGFGEFFNEWIDINSERLKFDPTMEQYPVPLEGVPAPKVDTAAVVAPSAQVETSISAVVSAVTNEVAAESEVAESNFEAISDNVQHEEGGKEVHCVQCQVKISQFRIYCMYCEVESKVEGSEGKPFNICLWCFSNAYPEHHDHPRSSFATKVIVGPRGVRPVKGGIITRFEKDLMDMEYKETERPENALVPDLHFQAMMGLESDQGFLYLDQWKDRKICAFCNDDGTTKDYFIGPHPFLLASTNRYGDTKKRNFWAHDACARHSPEVIQAKDGSWYNVSMAMRRGRTVKCTGCREKGATIGCFDPKCGRSFHVPCTGKPMSHFEDGVIFWCPQHERALMQRDAYDDTFSCDRCSKVLGVNPWHTCSKCSEDYFHTFDLCRECFSKDDINHEHEKDEFSVTSLELMYKEQLEKEAAAAQAIEAEEYAPVKKKAPTYKAKMRGLSRLVCSYCWSGTSAKWRKGYNGVLMCEDCFLAGPVNDIPMQPPMDMETFSDGVGSVPLSSVSLLAAQEEYSRGVGTYATSAEDYSHSPYLTRTAVSAVRFDHSSSQAVYLDSYGPAENQLFSLPIDTTYYDIPGRAPRWATHSGTDYHGTWLPQTVRRAVTKFTNPNDKILSNFLGRGTDAIECFLLGRCCTAVDINPAAVTLSIRNCSFAIPQDGSIKAEHRPTILQGDSRRLTGPLFENESFDHVLSHPPYKDCVAYSTHIDGDLSRFGNALEFQREMRSVVRESYRLLKMGRRCTLGIGDNREHCFYIPVSFQLIRQYINEGFELEELIFIATLRKVPKEEIDTMILEPDYAVLDDVGITSTVRAIPSCPVERKSVVMGSVWTFKPTEEYDFPTLCVSRMVERFGRNDANWEEYKLSFKIDNPDEPASEKWAEHAVEILPPEEDDLVSYERDRLQQIQENNRMLLALGLITDLSETSDDLGHQTKISKDAPCYPPPAQTTLRLVAHIPCTVLKPHQITAYRTTIMHLAKEALNRLPVSGIFIVGAQDIRTESGKLIPLGMLVMEDVIRAVGEDCLKLKELIEAVPDGYQKDRRKITNWGEFKEEPRSPGDGIPTHHLPIVHACYLVFTKVKERVVPVQETSIDEDIEAVPAN